MNGRSQQRTFQNISSVKALKLKGMSDYDDQSFPSSTFRQMNTSIEHNQSQMSIQGTHIPQEIVIFDQK